MTVRQIARQMLEAIIYDNDIVNRQEELNEDKLKPWLDKVTDKLIHCNLPLAIYTEEFIEEFCNGDVEVIVEQYPKLKELSDILDAFFNNPDVTNRIALQY